ncbi:MAG: serine/threonine protein kinase [Paracoccus denitrificans]|uniref:Serine/threonine protein kinase n=1 Tax=Paracoccus denitrificans TaxID=266 RepID=A0A533IG22_PARDE|nr:MAG: serine/threonine protein kinase [Paracoccus denitrificans]
MEDKDIRAGDDHTGTQPPAADFPEFSDDADRTVIETSKPGASPSDASPVPEADDEPQGFGPTFDPSPDRTVIATADDDAPAPTAQRTVINTTADRPPPPVAKPKLVEAGTLINNNYRIEALISAGGMGEVYRAINVYTGDPVAVKVVLTDLARDQDIIDLFRREARVLVQLRDEAIVSYHNFVLDQGLQRYCLIMEFVSGAHLGSTLREGQGMSDEQAVALMRRLARGLGQAHARGVTHRDLSPDNVILRHDRVEEAVLIDFGIARSTELGDGLAGRFAGKFKYIAPEQLGHYNGAIGPQTDIYGLALLMTAALRGSALEMGDSVVTASDARQQIPDLTGLSHRMFPLLQYMLEPDPTDRPSSMGQIIAMLDDPMRIPARYHLPLWSGQTAKSTPDGHTTGISESPFGLPMQAGPAEIAPPQAPKSGRLPLIMAGLATLIAIGAGTGWLLLRDTDPPIPVDPTAAETVTPVLPPRDPASRDGFLADLPLGTCAMAARVTSGPDSGTIAVYSAVQLDPAQVQDAYATAFGTRPAIVPRIVADAQCPAVEFAGALAGRTAAPPEVESIANATATGFQTQATVAGLDGRNLWLAMIAPDGSVYDLTSQASADEQGNIQAGVSVDVPNAAAQNTAPYVLLAVASSQPLVAVAATPAGAPAATLLPAILNELQSDGDAASASLSVLQPTPVPQDLPAP